MFDRKKTQNGLFFFRNKRSRRQQAMIKSAAAINISHPRKKKPIKLMDSHIVKNEEEEIYRINFDPR